MEVDEDDHEQRGGEEEIVEYEGGAEVPVQRAVEEGHVLALVLLEEEFKVEEVGGGPAGLRHFFRRRWD